ncbi:hypothetical protein HZS_2783, partial [Henneguya salminicola]
AHGKFLLTSMNPPKYTTDYIGYVQFNFPAYYNYDAAIGLMGKIWFYASIEYYQLSIFRVIFLDRNENYHGFFINIISIFWNKYKLKNKNCCARKKHENCKNPCSFYADFIVNGKKFTITNVFKGIETKNYNIEMAYIILESFITSTFKSYLFQRNPSVLLPK